MDEDPIREEKTIGEKILDIGKKIFSRSPKHENYFESPYSVDINDDIRNMEKALIEISKCGVTAEEFVDSIIKFNEIMTPNEIRKIYGLKEIK